MKLNNNELGHFVDKIKLQNENMSKYRNQINNLKSKLEDRIKNDESTGMKVSKYLLAGSWKKHTILKATGDNPIDIDLVLFVSGDDNIQNDLKKVHDYIVKYLEEIYPTKDILNDVDAEGNTKSIKIRFSGSGLEVDIVPVVPITNPENYTITFHEEKIDAENNGVSITNLTSYKNKTVSVDKVWARVEDENGCYKTSEVNLFVSTTQIPLTLLSFL